MSFTTPKIDWATDDVIATTDMNRAEENTRYLSGTSGGNLAAAESINVGITYKYFKLTASGGGLNIKYISTAGMYAGSRIVLQFPSDYSVLVYNLAGSAPSGYANIYLGATDLSFQTSVKEFLYDGTSWFIL